jgi:hypothetical protein
VWNVVAYCAFLPFIYSQDCNYSIAHSVWQFNTLTNETTPKNKSIFTANLALTPVLMEDKEWRSTGG